MPKYLSTQDLIDTYGELAFAINADHNEDGSSDINAVDSALAWAEGLADSYLGRRYVMPLPGVVSLIDPSLNDVGGALPGFVADIAVYRLAGIGHDIVTKEKKDRYNYACKWLEDVAKGDASLGLNTEPPTRTGVATISGPERVMTREGTDGVY